MGVVSRRLDDLTSAGGYPEGDSEGHRPWDAVHRRQKHHRAPLHTTTHESQQTSCNKRVATTHELAQRKPSVGSRLTCSMSTATRMYFGRKQASFFSCGRALPQSSRYPVRKFVAADAIPMGKYLWLHKASSLQRSESEGDSQVKTSTSQIHRGNRRRAAGCHRRAKGSAPVLRAVVRTRAAPRRRRSRRCSH